MATVPGLARANLAAFSAVGSHDWALMTEVGFRYQSAQAVPADDAIWARIVSGELDVAEGFAQADTVVDALLGAAAAEQPERLAGRVSAHQALEPRLRTMFRDGAAGA